MNGARELQSPDCLRGGSTGRQLVVSAIGLGCIGLSYGYGAPLELTTGDLADIASALASAPVLGERYAPTQQKMVGR